MRLSKRSIIMLVVMLLAVGTVVTGTLAFLTDTSSVTNTFTVGKVEIDLDEAKVNADGKPVDENGTEIADPENAPRVDGNLYHLVPGAAYVKDPRMTVKAGSEPSYVRMRVIISDYADFQQAYAAHGKVFQFAELVQGWDPAKWEYIPESETIANNKLMMEFRYFEIVDASKASEDIVLPALFTGFTAPAFFNGDDLASLTNTSVEGEAETAQVPMTIEVVGDAIQNTGFASADDAWIAFDAQMSAENMINQAE